ncbi:MAG: Methylglutaconyl-CoA hydratase [uncultured Rubrobacteraceae bacterium]|uniref:Methylglutaconyl-CoA hydratase n=1 Tax=uncultured Rubrobacteraceae bacterium TaxID=349277 RepID=A0A6J4QK17_9ACTN|nr:MAG: Methylglutaconyl-CoA hydratase [uncultured Rubrobacteraceae bacterium]
MSIVNKVTPKDELLGEARSLAEETAKNSPLALAYAKAAVDISIETSLEQGLRFETAAIRATLASEDYQAGLTAFAERRPPSSLP